MRLFRRSLSVVGGLFACAMVACSSSNAGGSRDGSVPEDAAGDGAPLVDASRDSAPDSTPSSDSGRDALADGALDGALDGAADATADATADAAVDSPWDASDAGVAADATADGFAPNDAGAGDAAQDAASSDASDGDSPTSFTFTVSGAAAKGPFASGSTISLAPLDGLGNSGAEAGQTTCDPLGRFSLSAPAEDGGAVQLTASGAYYHEALGSSSTASLSLNAIAPAASGGGALTANINLFTHLVAARAHALLADGGSTPAVAVQRAEAALYSALSDAGLVAVTDAGGAALSLLGGGDAAAGAYLLSLSATVDQAAMMAADGGALDLALAAAIRGLSSDFASGGTLSASDRSMLLAAQPCVRPTAVMDGIGSYFLSRSAGVSAPDINLALDTDLDGFPNDVDTCLLAANPVQSALPNAICDFALPAPPQPARVDGGAFVVPGEVLWAVGDVDKANGNDVVALSYGAAGTTLLVWLNNGDGSFAPGRVFNLASAFDGGGAVDPQLTFAQLIDMNRDGKEDLFVDYGAGETVGFFKGGGDGTFGAFVTLGQTSPDASSAGYSYVALGDLNSDGVPDVVGSGVSANGLKDTAVAVILSNGDAGTWGAPSSVVFSATAMQVGGVAIAPWRGGANNDVILGGSGGVYFLAGNGTGALVAPGAPWAGLSPVSMAVADFDGDGHLDLAVTAGSRKTPGPIEVQWGDGTTNPTASPYVLSTAIAPLICAVPSCISDYVSLAGQMPFVVGDVTGDGHPDILISASLAIAVNSGRSFSSPFGLNAVGDVCGGLSAAPIADLNQDGIGDVIAAPYSGSAPFTPILLNVAGVHTW